MCSLFPEKHFMKLIGNSMIIFILSWPWIFILRFKHCTSLNNFLQSFIFFFVIKSSHIIDWVRFFLFIKVCTWSNYCINCIFFKSSCFWVKISLRTFVKTWLFNSLRTICTWSWCFHFFYTSNNTKSISSWSKTWRNWFTSFELIIILTRTWNLFFLSFYHFSSFPSCCSFIVETWLRIWCKKARIWIIRLNFFHLIILIFPKS